MKRPSYQSLRVYQLAEKIADLVWRIVEGWGTGTASRTIGEQMIRSADSIGANIAEGSGRGSFQDNRRFVRIARGSLYETQHWLRRAYNRQLLQQSQIDELREILDELSPKLNAFLKSIGKSAKQTTGTPTVTPTVESQNN